MPSARCNFAEIEGTGKQCKWDIAFSAKQLYQRQNKIIHKAMTEIGMSYQDEKSGWLSLFGSLLKRKPISGLSALTLGERRRVIDYLAEQGVKVSNPLVPGDLASWSSGDAERTVTLRSKADRYPGRPKNMDHGSRAAQLKKIEALLTVGKKEWKYAHTLAQRICKADRIEWVPDHLLYKIITRASQAGHA